MRKLYLVPAMLGLTVLLTAQTSMPILSRGENAANPNAVKLMSGEKFANTNAVYQKLVQARGDFRYPPPKLIMSTDTCDCAKIDYGTAEITVEERAYDVCATFGADRDKALAILLGHELIHYYEKHGWQLNFINEFRRLQIGMKLDKLHSKIPQETQADYLGGFLAYTAGFGLFDQGPELIKRLYKWYHLDEQLPNYPVLDDREHMSRHTIKKIEKLSVAFEMANMMTVLGNYQDARSFYEFVMEEYQSRELFNNLGVVTLLEVLEETNQKFSFPVELELRFRSGRGSDGFASKKELLLKSAIKQFDAAINLDINYAPAYLNKACAYALLEDYQRAQFYAEIEAKQIAKAYNFTKTESDVNILLGIIAYMRNDSTGAVRLFEAEAKNNPLADKNLRYLTHKPDVVPGRSPRLGLTEAKPEPIDGLSLLDFESDIKYVDSLTLNISHQVTVFQYPLPSNNSKIYICYTSKGNTETQNYYHVTKPGYTGKTGGIGLGAKRQEIIDAFKDPKKIVQTSLGEVLVYKTQLFILDDTGKLVQWVNYYLPG